MTNSIEDQLEELGTTSKQFDFTIVQTSLEEAKRLFAYFSFHQQWILLSTISKENCEILIFRRNNRNFTIPTSEKIIIIFQQKGNNVRGIITSKSFYGQILDRRNNQKNITPILVFIQKLNTDEIFSDKALFSNKSFILPNPTIHIGYYLVSGLIIILIISFGLYSLNINFQLLTNSNFDLERNCQLAKIQYILEKEYANSNEYPQNIYTQPFLKKYQETFFEKTLPVDPKTKKKYSYEVNSVLTNYELSVQGSNKQIKKESLSNIPKKYNVRIHETEDTKTTSNLIAIKSNQELQCSVAQNLAVEDTNFWNNFINKMLPKL
ncbi:MAG: hypothetical protein WCO06_00985 [Candidatus Roizmanbacteria bacterium]